MNDYLLSFLLGIVEGVTEFLPVSSTAHLRIAESLFHLPLSEPYWKMYTIVIQLGAVLCLPVYFRKEIARFLRTFPTGKNGDRNIFNHPLSLTMIAFVVTALPAYALSKKIGENLENFKVIGGALLIGGAVMWAVDALFGEVKTQAPEPTAAQALVPTAPAHGGTSGGTSAVLEYATPATGQTTSMDQMSIPQAIWIGACQILSAVFPGTSRSMSTIAGGQTAGMTRAAALEFSFFLSMPTMFVATLFTLKKAILPGHNDHTDPFNPGTMNAHQWIVLAIGFVVSFFVAWAVVAWFMAWVRRRGFVPFAVYRIILGIAVLVSVHHLAHG